MWADVPRDELLGTWADGLAPYEGSDILAALQATRELHKEFPPTMPQFADLCRNARRARMETTQALPGPKTEMPDHVRAQLRSFIARHTQ